MAAAHHYQGGILLDGKLELHACSNVFHCRRRIPTQPHPSFRSLCLRSRAPLAFSMPPSVLRMLASACESARAGYGAEVRCWILIGASARAARLGLRLRLGLESDLLAESSMFVAESDGCPSQFAFRSQPWHGMLQLRQRMDMAVTERVDRRGGGGEGGARGRRCGGN